MEKVTQTLTLPSGDQASRRGWRHLLVKAGRWKSLLIVTTYSVLSSVVLTVSLSLLLGASREEFPFILALAIIVPALVAPSVTHFLMQLLFELEDTRAQLLNLATRDSLTQTYNRRYLMERLEIETTRALRTKTSLSLIMVDIDNFKSVNDTYGHATGDRVLQGMAESFMKLLRSYDVLARLGGEEFVLLLPNVSLEHACTVAERLRAVAAIFDASTDDGTLFKITVSLGVSTLAPSDTNHLNLLNQADQALYQAKRNGKNRWAC